MSNLILDLPVEVLVNIFKQLDRSDLRNVMLTCKRLREIVINDNTIWKHVSRSRLLIGNCSHNSSSYVTRLSSYHRCRIAHNWCKGIFKITDIVYKPIKYMPWLHYYNSEALIVSFGSLLECYKTDRRGIPSNKDMMWSKYVPTIKRWDVRTNDISRFIVKRDLLIAGNRDGCASVYKLTGIKNSPTLLHHIKDCHEDGKVEVSAVELVSYESNSCMVTASCSSPELCFWRFNFDGAYQRQPANYDHRRRRKGVEKVLTVSINDGPGVRCLATSSTLNKLAVGPQGNSYPLLVDVNTGKTLITAEQTINMKQSVCDIQFHNDNVLAYVTHAGILRLLDIRTNHVVYKAMDPFQATLYCLKSDGNNSVIVGSSEYSRCVLYDVRRGGEHVQLYFSQKKSSPVYSLDFDFTKLITGVDHGIGLLEFNTNSTTTKRRDYSDFFSLKTIIY